jgi:7-cyano-7-deazaguanine synthase
VYTFSTNVRKETVMHNDAMRQVEGGSALVVLSGGQDSTTALFWALERWKDVRAVTIDYNQRHRLEIDAARKVALLAGVPHEIVEVGPVLTGTSPLTNPQEKVEHYPDSASLPGGLEKTFVPLRNPFFITIAANRAAVMGTDNLVMGLCQEDYGGYPDCRATFVQKMQEAISQALYGTDTGFTIHCPLMFLTKAESVRFAKARGPVCWEALGFSHTDYDGQYPPVPFNHASLLRARGFNQADECDPLILRAKSEGKLPDDYPCDGLVEGTVYGNPTTWADAVRAGLEARNGAKGTPTTAELRAAGKRGKGK